MLGRPLQSRGDVSVFAGSVGYLHRFQPAADNAPTGMVLHDRLSTGQFVVERGRGITILTRAPELGRLVADSVTFGLLSAGDSGAAAGHVAWLPAVVRAWGYVYPWPNDPIPSRDPSRAPRVRPRTARHVRRMPEWPGERPVAGA